MKRSYDKHQKSTFVVKIFGNENGTWQGRITYAEGNQIQYFRSMLEMIQLIDEAVSSKQEGEELEASS